MEALQKKDLRNVRNEKAIKTALRVLLNKKEYEEITVGEIAEQANVARSTFYVYFKNKGECLKALIYDALDACIAAVDWHFLEGLGKSDEAPGDLVIDRFFDAARQYAPVYQTAFSIFSYKELQDLAFPRLYREYYAKQSEHERLVVDPVVYQAYRKVHGQYILDFIQIAIAEDSPLLSQEEFRQLLHIWVYNFAKIGGYCKSDSTE